MTEAGNTARGARAFAGEIANALRELMSAAVMALIPRHETSAISAFRDSVVMASLPYGYLRTTAAVQLISTND